MKKNLLLAILTTVIILPMSCWPVQAQEVDPKFNPNLILSDEELLDYDSLSLQQIQSFLENQGSYLATYRTTNAHGTVKSAAEIIYDAANNNYDCEDADLSDAPTEAEKKAKCRHITTVNPKFLLVLLQKEASLVEDPSPSQSHLDWATGYGCPDNWACNPYYKGFGKQVNSASLQFLAYVNESSHYPYQAGNTYTINNTLDPYCTTENQTMSVTPANKATAALYDYTPHVFNGNYNVYKLYQRYFPTHPARYPDGSLLQAKNEVGVWLIQNGKKRPFLSKSALISRYSLDKIITVDKSELEPYTKGAPISLPNYSLVRATDKSLYLIVGDQKRKFASQEVFKKFGFNPGEIIEVSAADLENYDNGTALTAASTYPTGALMRDPKTGGVYYVQDGQKAPIIDKTLLAAKFKGKTIMKVTAAELAQYKKIAPILFDNGELLKSNSANSVYLIVNGQKRPFQSGSDFEKLGYKWNNIISVSPQLLYLYPLGDPITYDIAENE